MNAAIKQGHSSLDVARYIINKCAESGANNSLTPMQVLKLVYIAHGWMLGLTGRPLICDQVEAWRYGPVIPKLYHAIKGYRSNVVAKVPRSEEVEFDPSEQSIMDQVCTIYGPSTGLQLSQLTHKDGSPWAKTWNSEQRGCVISNDVIEAHYAKLAQERRSA